MNETNDSHTPSCQGATLTPKEITRRHFLERLSLITGGVGALILAVPIAGFILAPFFARKHEIWRSVGKVESFKIGETTAVQYEDASPLPWAGVTATVSHRVRRADRTGTSWQLES